MASSTALPVNPRTTYRRDLAARQIELADRALVEAYQLLRRTEPAETQPEPIAQIEAELRALADHVAELQARLLEARAHLE